MFREANVVNKLQAFHDAHARLPTPNLQQKPTLYVHAALMIVAWVFLIPLGVILARHK